MGADQAFVEDRRAIFVEASGDLPMTDVTNEQVAEAIGMECKHDRVVERHNGPLPINGPPNFGLRDPVRSIGDAFWALDKKLHHGYEIIIKVVGKRYYVMISRYDADVMHYADTLPQAISNAICALKGGEG